MVYAQPSSCPEEWQKQTSMGLWHTNGSPNLGQKIRPYSNQQKKKKKKKRKKKRSCKIVDFELKNYGTWRWRSKICKLEDEWRPSKVQQCWEQPGYWEESWKLEETCCPSNSSESPLANADVKNPKGVNN